MSQQQPPSQPPSSSSPGEAEHAAAPQNAVAVISAYGAFRVLLILLAVWTFFEGFALFTGGISGLQFAGGGDHTASRVVGAQMLVFVPVYALLAWNRDRYRLLIWVPYGAQVAVILPTAWSVLHGDFDSVLLLIVSIIFFALLFYFWWHSHPLDFFAEDDVDDDALEDEDEDDDDDSAAPARGARATSSQPTPSRARDLPKRGRFRRRG